MGNGEEPMPAVCRLRCRSGDKGLMSGRGDASEAEEEEAEEEEEEVECG